MVKAATVDGARSTCLLFLFYFSPPLKQRKTTGTLTDLNPIGNFPMWPFVTNDCILSNSIGFLWDAWIHRNFGGKLTWRTTWMLFPLCLSLSSYSCVFSYVASKAYFRNFHVVSILVGLQVSCNCNPVFFLKTQCSNRTAYIFNILRQLMSNQLHFHLAAD